MKSREYTPDEVREKFLQAVWEQISWWTNETRTKSTEGRLSGLAHSMLSLIDGNNDSIPAFILSPLPHADDKMYHKANGCNFFPQNERSKKTGAAKKVKSDIGGRLASELYRVKERMDKKTS